MRPRSESRAFVLRVWLEADDPEVRGQVVDVADGQTEAARGRRNLLDLIDRRLRRLEGSHASRDAAATPEERSDHASGT